jgi:hypothetical protein
MLVLKLHSKVYAKKALNIFLLLLLCYFAYGAVGGFLLYLTDQVKETNSVVWNNGISTETWMVIEHNTILTMSPVLLLLLFFTFRFSFNWLTFDSGLRKSNLVFTDKYIYIRTPFNFLTKKYNLDDLLSVNLDNSKKGVLCVTFDILYTPKFSKVGRVDSKNFVFYLNWSELPHLHNYLTTVKPSISVTSDSPLT